MTIAPIDPATTSGTVLIVDDEAALRFPIAEVLRQAGLTVIEAASADEAINWLWEDRHIGLVFSDVRMPGSMDGLGLAEMIEAMFVDVKVILTSATMPSQLDPIRLVIPKPYSLEVVSAQILSQLHGARR